MYRITIVFFVLLLSSCRVILDIPNPISLPDIPLPKTKIDIDKIIDPAPHDEGKSKYGNPKSYVVFGKRYYVMDSAQGFREEGIASWYGNDFHGKKTSNGEIYDMYAMTAAHKNLPLPTYVKVLNLENHRSVIVRVNDRGPFHQGRIIDLSYSAAYKLGIHKKGTARVRIAAIFSKEQANQTIPPILKPSSIEATPPTVQGKHIQIAAFKNKDSADRLVLNLQQSVEHPIKLVKKFINDQTFYRVVVGPVSSAASDNLLKYLQSEFSSAARFIIE